jgi:ATP-dependent DNA helicase RecG
MQNYSSGFDLAEFDLKMRGPGEVYGVRQSGVPDLKIANLNDLKFLEKVRACADKLISDDIMLLNYPKLKKIVNNKEVKLT